MEWVKPEETINSYGEEIVPPLSYPGLDERCCPICDFIGRDQFDTMCHCMSGKNCIGCAGEMGEFRA